MSDEARVRSRWVVMRVAASLAVIAKVEAVAATYLAELHASSVTSNKLA